MVKIKNIFIFYAVCLVNFATIKYFGNMQRVIDRIESIKEQRNEGYSNISYVPFRTITSSIDTFIRVGVVPSSIYFIANIIAFIPMGFLFPCLMQKPSFLKTMCVAFAIIIGIETIQYVTFLGAADIDDVLLNLGGCVVGYMMYSFSGFVYKQHYKVKS